MHAKHYKHIEDGRTVLGVCGNGSVLLSHWGNVVTRIGIHTYFRGSDKPGMLFVLLIIVTFISYKISCSAKLNMKMFITSGPVKSFSSSLHLQLA